MRRRKGNGKGLVGIALVMVLAIMTVLVVAVLPSIADIRISGNISTASSYLESRGYIVLGQTERVGMDLIPTTDSTYDVGSVSNKWAEGYFDKVYVGGTEVVRSVTFVVAASDSLASSKAQADFVCNGTNDQEEINTALTAGAGGRVSLSEGNYQTTANIVVPANTHFSGMGKGTILTTTNTVAITNMVVINGDNVTISDMKLVLGAGAGDTGSRPNVIYANTKTLIWLENLWIVGDTTVANDMSDVRQCGICFVTVTDSKVVNCRSEDTARHGIILSNSSNNNTITGNTFQDNDSDGIQLALTSNNNTITGNVCHGVAVDGITLEDSHQNTIADNFFQADYVGICIWGASYNTIIGNVVQGSTYVGIILEPSGNNSNHNIVTGNICLDNNRGIIVENNSDDNMISGNTCQGNDRNGILIDGCLNNTITGNTCQGNGESGIWIDAAHNSTITGNACHGNVGYGIELNGSENCSVSGNICTDNDSGGNTYSGIDVDQSPQVTISGNQCHANGLHGINIYRSSYCTVTGNVCYDQNTGDGISVYGDVSGESKYNSLIANICTSNASNGIEIAGADYASKNIVRDNQLTDNTGASLVDNGTNTEIYSQSSDLFLDVLAVTANYVVDNEDLSAGLPITFTLAAQPDVPRTLSGHFDSHTNITVYTIAIVGVDAKGRTITETLTEADGWDWETDNAFATVTSITMSVRTGTGAGDTMDIGITDVLGLSNVIYATGDVYKIKKNNANAVVAGAQVDTTYGTYDFAVVGLAGADDFTIWFRSNLNIVD